MKPFYAIVLTTVFFLLFAWITDLFIAVQIVVWTITAVVFLFCLVVLVYFAAIAREKFLETRAGRRRAEAITWRESAIIAPPGHQIYLPGGQLAIAAHLTGHQERWEYYHRYYGKRDSGPVIEMEQQPPQLPAPQADIITLLAQEQRLLLNGPSGAGKSSNLRHLIAHKLGGGSKVVLIDPHGSRPKWGTGVDAVGFGERWDEILEKFQALEWEHTCRIRKIEQGHAERDFPIITVVIEELQGIVRAFKQQKIDISRYTIMLFSRTRKTGIDIIAATQEKTVGATGLEGFGGNLDALTIVECMGKDGRGHRLLYPDAYGNVTEYPAPPFWPDTRPVGVRPEMVVDLARGPGEQGMKILEMADKGIAKNKISSEIFGYKNGRAIKTIDDIIAEFGGDYLVTTQ